MGHRAAWEQADEGARRVADLVDTLTPAEPIVNAAMGRVWGMRATRRGRLRAAALARSSGDGGGPAASLRLAGP